VAKISKLNRLPHFLFVAFVQNFEHLFRVGIIYLYSTKIILKGGVMDSTKDLLELITVSHFSRNTCPKGDKKFDFFCETCDECENHLFCDLKEQIELSI
jgi:hypothetical protein